LIIKRYQIIRLIDVKNYLLVLVEPHRHPGTDKNRDSRIL
jgi:hypothetical protein